MFFEISTVINLPVLKFLQPFLPSGCRDSLLFFFISLNIWVSSQALKQPAAGKLTKHVQIALWEYCDKPYDKSTSKSVKNYYTATELRQYLEKYDTINDLPTNCNADLVKRLLVTSGIVNRRVKETWNEVGYGAHFFSFRDLLFICYYQRVEWIF